MNDKKRLSTASDEMSKPGEKKSREDTFEYERAESEEKEHVVKTAIKKEKGYILKPRLSIIVTYVHSVFGRQSFT